MAGLDGFLFLFDSFFLIYPRSEKHNCWLAFTISLSLSESVFLSVCGTERLLMTV
jgi:hypothetical protein